MIRSIEDIRYHVHEKELVAYMRDMRGEVEKKNVLDFSAEELYTILLEVYELGDRDARRRIADALAGRTSHS